jgi:serine/threonine protein kinase
MHCDENDHSRQDCNTSYSLTSMSHTGRGGGGGTIGWSPPEVYQKKTVTLPQPPLPLSDVDVDVDAPPCSDGNTEEMSALATFKAGDIFSLGCVFHFVLVPGQHPFGDTPHDRLNNILTNDPTNLSQLKEFGDDCSYDLISRMIRHTPSHRPNMSQISHHPFFWSSTQKLDFLNDLSDRLQFEIKSLESIFGLKHFDQCLSSLSHPTSDGGGGTFTSSWFESMKITDLIAIRQKFIDQQPLLVDNVYVRMESLIGIKPSEESFIATPVSATAAASSSTSASWETGLPQPLIDDLMARGKYNFTSRSDCLRMIRNKRRHRDEIPKLISALFETDDLFYSYFNRLYPDLFMSAILVACKYLPTTDPLIQKYCMKLVGLFDVDVVHCDNRLQDLILAMVTTELKDSATSLPIESCERRRGLSTGSASESTFSESTSGGGSSTPSVDKEKEKKVFSSRIVSTRGAASGGGGTGEAPANFRTRLCHRGSSCPYRAKGKCTFAHSEEELIIVKRKKKI